MSVSGLPSGLTAALEGIVEGFGKLVEEYEHDQAQYEKTLKKESKGKKTDFKVGHCEHLCFLYTPMCGGGH